MAMRPKFTMPPQVVRLCLLVVGIVVTYSTARYFLTPPSFRQYGWFRGDALGELSDHDRVYAGRKACAECHEDVVKKVTTHGHKTLSCEGCHGPGQNHADNPDLKPEKLHFSICMRCHEANPSRPKWHKQIVIKTHYSKDEAVSKCTECHIPHMPEETP